MQTLLAHIDWYATPEIFTIGGFSLRWYGLLFASAFLFGLFIVRRMFAAEKAPEEWLDKVFMYMVIGTVIGARLGHVFFYDWDYYSQHPIDIIKVWEGGLASHGGALGIIIALWFFSKYTAKRSILWILDRVVVPTALGGFFIRMGNLMNSEIVGNPSDVSWAFIFHNASPAIERVPRHPVQLYEALCYLVSFAILYYIYWRTDKKDKSGFIFGAFMMLIWGVRFWLEYYKNSQGGMEEYVNNALSTGQLLSIPFFLVGAYFVFRPTPSKKLFVKK